MIQSGHWDDELVAVEAQYRKALATVRVQPTVCGAVSGSSFQPEQFPRLLNADDTRPVIPKEKSMCVLGAGSRIDRVRAVPTALGRGFAPLKNSVPGSVARDTRKTASVPER